ncbi:MAG: glutamyl-tRNA synthetase [Patescibacteria group bacterium]|nr:glutamyl-tRNA synthetase [Patescibacteria group bacterium]
MSERKVVTRMAPSPTGKFHVGSVRTALYNYLFARQNGGKFILRIEDTDKERSKKEFEADIVEAFDWLGFDYDEFYRQSERTEIYRKHIQKLIDNGHAYISEEEATEEGKRSSVIRFKNPKIVVKFSDVLLGDIEVDTTDLGDFVIAKDLENPLYHLTVVVDDGLMDVTHVIRGQDHISNTPRQILILEALGFLRPVYAHIPLILAPDKTKLSKRHGALATLEYRDIGYFKEAMINFMALIGWNPGDEREIFSKEELIKDFKLEKVQKGGGVFNIEKLNWFNKQYLLKKSKEEIKAGVKYYVNLPDDVLERALPTLTERIHKFSDLKEENLSFYNSLPHYDVKDLIWKNSDEYQTKTYLENVINLLENANFSSVESIKESVWDYAEEKGRGDVLWPIRFALSGLPKSPDPFTLAYILGKAETIERIQVAHRKISEMIS